MHGGGLSERRVNFLLLIKGRIVSIVGLLPRRKSVRVALDGGERRWNHVNPVGELCKSAFWGKGGDGDSREGQKRLTRPITQYPRYEKQVESTLELERAKILCARGPSPISSVKLTAGVSSRGIVWFDIVPGRK